MLYAMRRGKNLNIIVGDTLHRYLDRDGHIAQARVSNKPNADLRR